LEQRFSEMNKIVIVLHLVLYIFKYNFFILILRTELEIKTLTKIVDTINFFLTWKYFIYPIKILLVSKICLKSRNI